MLKWKCQRTSYKTYKIYFTVCFLLLVNELNFIVYLPIVSVLEAAAAGGGGLQWWR